MRHAMWMGTRGYEMWVPTPKISPGYNRPGYTSQTALLNGGTTMRASKAAHQQYVFEWNNGRRADLAPLRDIADGLYDTVPGVNLVYFNDPVAMDQNLLPQHWAAPALGGEDAPSLAIGQRPSLTLQPQGAMRLPSRAAVFAPVTRPRALYVPLPPGYTALFGWVGAGTGVTLTPAMGLNQGTALTPAPVAGEDGTQTNTSIARSGSTTGVIVSLAAGSSPTIRAMTLRMLPSGRGTPLGPFLGGRGHSGCQFTDKGGLVPLSVPLDLIAASATLEETGDWL